MAKRLPFRDNSPQVKDAVDQIQRGDFLGQELVSSFVTSSNGFLAEDNGLYFGTAPLAGTSRGGTNITVSSTRIITGGDIDGTFMKQRIGGQEFMRFVLDTGISNQDQIVFNNDAEDVDFIVKGDTDENLIKVQAGRDTVGIGVADPRAKLEILLDNDDTWQGSGRFYSDYPLVLKNTSDTNNAFTGIAFDVSSETNRDAIGAAIVALNRDTDAANHHTDLVFATNPDSDGDLTERMRITENGHVGIGVGAGSSGLGTTADAGLHILATQGASNGNLVVQCTEAGIDSSQSLVNLRWTGDSNITTTNYWVKFVRKSAYSSAAVMVGSINSEVTYSPFTGQHNTLVPSGSIRPGMILKSTGEVFYRKNIDNAWVITETTTVEKDKAVAGAYAGLTISAEESVVGEQLAGYNAVGEGSILVTDAGGNIETGDYICSSNNLGHGMKQDDDLLHNYTVAKANEPIDFSTVEVDPELGFKSFLLACTYHCG